MSLVPLYGFLQGDTLGVLVLVHETDPVSEIAVRLIRAATSRVVADPRAMVLAHGRELDPTMSVERAGLEPLDRVDVVPRGATW